VKGSLGAAVSSSPGNSLLQKCRERLRTIEPKWSDPSPDPAQAGATCTGLRAEEVTREMSVMASVWLLCF
jgi:hypothetical protein